MATFDERSTPARPTPPLELARSLHCPLFAAIGAEDHNPSVELGARLREETSMTQQEVHVELYEGAGHAFFADYRPTYRAAPAAQLWRDVVPFLERHLLAD
jgi:carboxymethylenebutenolidase